MIREEKAKIIHGLVRHDAQWVPIARKLEMDKARRDKIEKGLVLFQGEWVPIADKAARVRPAQAPSGAAETPRQVTINKQVYNVRYHTDNRRIQQDRHEHRHVHVDTNGPAQSGRLEDEPYLAQTDAAGLCNSREFTGIKGRRPAQIEGRQKQLPEKGDGEVLPPPGADQVE